MDIEKAEIFFEIDRALRKAQQNGMVVPDEVFIIINGVKGQYNGYNIQEGGSAENTG